MERVRRTANISVYLLLSGFCACDPVRGVSGRVRSVPPPEATQPAPAPEPLGGAVVTLTCGERPLLTYPDPDKGKHVLAISKGDGTFEYRDIGFWGSDCVLEFESGDGSHDKRRIAVKDLCKERTGIEDCLQMGNVTVDLVRRRESDAPVTLRLVTEPANLELVADEQSRCHSPCEMKVSPGLHRLALYPSEERRDAFWREQATLRKDSEVRVHYESRLESQKAASWFFVPVVAGIIMAPIALSKQDETLAYWSGGLIAAGGLGFLVVWRPDKVDVSVRPMAAKLQQATP